MQTWQSEAGQTGKTLSRGTNIRLRREKNKGQERLAI